MSGSTARLRKRKKEVEEETETSRKSARIAAAFTEAVAAPVVSSTNKKVDTRSDMDEKSTVESKHQQQRPLRNGHRLSTPCGGVQIRRGEFGSGVRTLSQFQCKRGQILFPGVPVDLVSENEYREGSVGLRWHNYGVTWKADGSIIAVPRASDREVLCDLVFLCNAPCRERGEKANAQYKPDYKNNRLGLKALCAIGAEEDILVSYGPAFAKHLHQVRQEQERADAAAMALASMKDGDRAERQAKLRPFERLCVRCLGVFHRTRFVRHRFECAAAADSEIRN